MLEADAMAQPSVAPSIGRIPVRNVWLLMLYASDLFRLEAFANVALEEAPDEIPDLVGEVLAHLVEHRLRRNLSQGYRPRSEVLGRVRGRIDLLATETGSLLLQGKIACRFEEMTLDTPRNRFVRAALERLAERVGSHNLAHRLRSLASTMARLGVAGRAPSRTELAVDRLGRHDAQDRFMLAAARLAFDLTLPTETKGDQALGLPVRDEVWMRRLFEKAIAGFYQVTLTPFGWKVVAGKPLQWAMEAPTSRIAEIFPTMRTDIILDPPSEGRIVIDTKFTSLLTEGWWKTATLRSGYIYQIYAYLRSQAGRGDSRADRASGLLLHPAIQEEVDESVTIQGHRIRFATVNLADDAVAIRNRLLSLIATP